MTYCVAMRLAEGLVFMSDTRTNAGFDQISTFKKMHQFNQPNERALTLLSAGNLATSQSIMSLLQKRIGTNLQNVFSTTSMYETAELVGRTMREVIQRDACGGPRMVDFSCSLVLGGQILGEPPRLFMIYSEGNFIESTRETPYFQIGESKYGKPILDRVMSYETPLDRAFQCALISFDSTMKSNLSVGMPLDVSLYRQNELVPCYAGRIDEHNEYFQNLRTAWHSGLQNLITNLVPPFLNAPQPVAAQTTTVTRG